MKKLIFLLFLLMFTQCCEKEAIQEPCVITVITTIPPSSVPVLTCIPCGAVNPENPPKPKK